MVSSVYTSFKDYGWVFSGVAVGCTLGSLHTYFKTGSFVTRNYPVQLDFKRILGIGEEPLKFVESHELPHYHPIIETINKWREKEFTFCRNRYLKYISFFHVIPFAILIIQSCFDWKKKNYKKLRLN